MALVLAVLAGGVIGLCLGALGGGGSILAVPVFVYLLGQTPAQATTASLVVVAVTAVVGAIAAVRTGQALVGRGVAFGVLAVGGAVLGAHASTRVDQHVLLASFSALMLVVGSLMALRLRRSGPDVPGEVSDASGLGFAEPIIRLRPTFACACPRVLQIVVAATLIGLLTGFLGVGGGFLIVPALLLGLRLPIRAAAGTSLVVMAITSASALAVRAGIGAPPSWGLVVALTAASAASAVVGTRLSVRIGTARLSGAFTALVLLVAVYTATRAAPAFL